MKLQRTLRRPARFSGIGVHTGNRCTITFLPADPDAGIRFVRKDLSGTPAVEASVGNVVDTTRGTTLGNGGCRVHTVEHVLAALHGTGIDNLTVELDSNEPPVGDGSALPFTRMVRNAGVQEQDVPRRRIVFREPVWLGEGESSLIALPSEEVRVSYAAIFEQAPLSTQFISFLLSEEFFEREVAPARTFCFSHEVDELMRRGLIRGGSLDNAVVIGEGVIFSKERLRFPDEFVRHKVLDLLGDIYLLGAPFRGHLIAIKSGHALNVRMAERIRGVVQDGKEEALA